jgi:nucleoside-diphosphate-sugar epimerase
MDFMRILLTGGSGFLGAKVVRLLTENCIETICLVRRQCDLENEILWDFVSPLPDLPQVDALLHMAAAVTYDNLSDVVFQNVAPVTRLAEWASRKGIAVYYTSSASVHGRHQPWKSDSPVSPADMYAASKLTGEYIFTTLCPKTTIFRLTGIYGINGPRHLGLNEAITNAYCRGEAPILHGSGSGLRNYICVDDAAAWIVAEILANHQGSEPIYMAGKETMPLWQWLQIVVNILLPGKGVVLLPGSDTDDVVTELSPPPLPLRSFSEYILSLFAEEDETLPNNLPAHRI